MKRTVQLLAAMVLLAPAGVVIAQQDQTVRPGTTVTPQAEATATVMPAGATPSEQQGAPAANGAGIGTGQDRAACFPPIGTRRPAGSARQTRAAGRGNGGAEASACFPPIGTKPPSGPQG